MISGILVLSSFLLLVTGPFSAQGASIPKTSIAHRNVSSFGGEPHLRLEVNAKDPAGIKEVRCYFRFDPALPFIFIDMKQTGPENFSTVLPVSLISADTMEYLFLVVNHDRQVILSPNFSLERNRGDDSFTGEASIDFDLYDFKSEVAIMDSLKKYFADSDRIGISAVSSQESYGITAGLYPPERIDYEIAAGYFGAFRLDPAGEVSAVKGYMILGPSGTVLLRTQSANTAEITAKKEEENVFPDIAGSNWTGFFWRSDMYTSSLLPLTAEVTIDEEGWVTITTSKENLGHYLEGRVNTEGYMLLYDQYDGEDWTTHYGPASDLHIKIADYIYRPTLEKPSPPLNIIELKRSEVEKEIPIITPGIILLLKGFSL
jgi:hypothetical protein